MKSAQMVGMILVVVAVVLLGYGLFVAMPFPGTVSEEVSSKVEELTPPAERKAVDTNILNSESVKKIETYQVNESVFRNIGS
jgi:Tfp pilus assembly protein PilO